MRCRRLTTKPFDAIDSCSFKHVEADHGVVVHDHGVVGLDETHASHIGSKIEDVICTTGDLEAVVHDPEVDEMELVAEHVLAHVLVLLPVGGDDVVALALETPGDVGGDEASGAGDADPERPGRPVGLPLQVLVRVCSITGSVMPGATHSATIGSVSSNPRCFFPGIFM